MTKKKSNNIDYLKLVWPPKAHSEGHTLAPEVFQTLPVDVPQTSPVVANSTDPRVGEAATAEEPKWWRDAVDEFNTPMEETRLRLSAIDDIEELAKEINDGELWVYGALHDELRRARSGTGHYSRVVARRSDDVFMMGYALSLAYEGDGPLSTPIDWDELIEMPITLNEQLRPDAIELLCCRSFMMH
jgi:hypothetical protein